MSDMRPDMGGRLPLIDPIDLAPEAQQALEVLKRTFLPYAAKAGFLAEDDDGRLIGPFNSALYSPEISATFLEYQTAEQQHSTLDRRVREVVILTVGAVWRSDYELYAHAIVARGAGLPEAVVEALCAGQAPDALNATEAIAHRIARALTVERRLDATLFENARTTFGLRGLVDLFHLVGAYQTVCGVLNGFAIPAPDA